MFVIFQTSCLLYIWIWNWFRFTIDSGNGLACQATSHKLKQWKWRSVTHCGSCQIGSWLCHAIETLSALLALCESNPLVISGFPHKWPVLKCFVDACLCKRLNKQWSCQLFEMPWRSCDATVTLYFKHKYDTVPSSFHYMMVQIT